MQDKKIKVAFLVDGDINDVNLFSGTTLHTAKALERQPEIDLHIIDNIEKSRNYFTLILGAIYSRLLRKIGKEYKCRWTLGTAKRFVKDIEKRLPKDTDVIFSMATTMSLAFLKTDIKTIYYSEGPCVNMFNEHPYLLNLCNRSIKDHTILEKNAFDNADLLLFPTDWAINNAIKSYNLDKSKAKVIPFGANIDTKYSDTEIQNIIINRSVDKCRLLFIGVSWKYKGADVAVEIAKELHLRNIDVHLDIVGIKDVPVPLPAYITNHSFISKQTKEGKNKLIKLFKEAHFFVLPTLFDCAPIVIAEASSFAVPSLSTKVGGVACVVRDNLNGMTFDLSASVTEYVDYIANLFNDRAEYERLCYSTFNEYKTRLNWDTSGRKFVETIKELVDK